MVSNEEEIVNSLFDNYYFKINKMFQVYTGTWPFNSGSKKIIPGIVFNVVLLFFIIPIVSIRLKNIA